MQFWQFSEHLMKLLSRSCDLLYKYNTEERLVPCRRGRILENQKRYKNLLIEPASKDARRAADILSDVSIEIQRKKLTLGDFSCRAAPATIRNPPANRPANVASDVIVTCTAIGNLPIQLIWLNGTRPMTNSSRVSITTASKHGMINSTLTVRRLVLQDTRSYSCSVINTFGRDFKVFNITAQRKFLYGDKHVNV